MLAIVKAGGKQYKVREGEMLKINRIPGDEGDEVALNEVLAILDEKDGESVIGCPLVEGAAVKAKIVSQEKDGKIIVFKKKRRQNYRRKQGHRQHVTLLRVESISK